MKSVSETIQRSKELQAQCADARATHMGTRFMCAGRIIKKSVVRK